MNKRRVLVLDDDPHILESIEDLLSQNGYEISAFISPKKGLDYLAEHDIDLILSDVKMNEMTGDEVLNHVIKNYPGIGVILITGFGNVVHSVNALRKGAYDYITKPFSSRELLSRVNHFFSSDSSAKHVAVSSVSNKKENPQKNKHSSAKQVRKTITAKTNLVGEDPKIKELLSALNQIAPTSASVMIQGESGTGKEVFARLIHEKSDRADRPYIRINCANLPSELVESTLFGHVKGAFTGAIENKNGAFYEADGGTLLLDEVTEIDINIQAKLLRVLQEKEFTKVGSQKPQQVDVRIIATSNRNIAEAIHNGEFRKDLYFRLNVFPIVMPPLNDRPGDILLLAEHFIKKYTKEYHLPDKKLSKKLQQHLQQRRWKGNVRELENYIQRGVIMSQRNETIELEHVENTMFNTVDESLREEVLTDLPVLPIEEMELQMIKKALEKTNGNQKEAAKLLKVSDRTIRNKLKKIDFPSD